MTHTKGPWDLHATAGNHDFSIYGDDGKDIALVRDFHEANARLIAAAPELLEALDALLWAAAEKTLKQKEEIWEQARRAIAKANGE